MVWCVESVIYLNVLFCTISIINSMVKSAITGLIAQVTSNGKATNCTRRSRVLLTLPVLVTSAINPLLHENHTIDC